MNDWYECMGISKATNYTDAWNEWLIKQGFIKEIIND